MNHIFISYSRKDIDVVTPLTERLRGEGVDIWLDTSGSGTGIPFSTKWFSVIEEALHMAGGAVIIRSENWENSTPCGKELEIIQKCDIPYLELSPESIREDINAAIGTVKRFIKEKVRTKANDYRTLLFASSYEIKSGVSPYRLVRNKKKFLEVFLSTVFEYGYYKRLIRRRQYAVLNPELFPFIKKYLGFLIRSLLFKTAGVAVTFVAVILAIVFIQAIPMAMKQGSQQNQNTYYGQYAAAGIGSAKESDPVRAIEMAEGLDEEYLSVTSYGSLCMSGTQLIDAALPEKVLTEQDEGYKAFISAGTVDSSPLYTAEPSADCGGIVLTDTASGEKRTLNTAGAAENIAWSSGGNLLAFSVGSDVYVYDAVGKGAPVKLFENYERISELKFTDTGEGLYVAAVTDSDAVVLWRSPFDERADTGRTTDYGVFTGDDEPTAVYIDGKDIVINRNNTEEVISPDIPDSYGKIRTPYYAVTPDGGRIAFICESGDKTRIVCVDLKNGKTLADVPTDYTASSVTFSPDEKEIVASADQCAIIRVDIALGSVEYGPYEDLYFANITNYSDRYLLTDYYGNCCIFDGTVFSSDLGAVNYAYMPYFALAVNSDDGYLFTVNRGAGTTAGCSRFDLNTGAVNLFVVPEAQGVDANTAVALSEDGKYVAFGYPNGMIRVYEQKNMYLIFESVCAAESVSSIRFGKDDSAIYILGSTGKIYSAGLPALGLSTDLNSMRSNWAAIVKSLSEKKAAYFRGSSAETE